MGGGADMDTWTDRTGALIINTGTGTLTTDITRILVSSSGLVILTAQVKFSEAQAANTSVLHLRITDTSLLPLTGYTACITSRFEGVPTYAQTGGTCILFGGGIGGANEGCIQFKCELGTYTSAYIHGVWRLG